MYKALFCLWLLLSFAAGSFAQNKFEGMNILVSAPTDQKTTACAVRYVPPTTAITITDLNPATPLKISSCTGEKGFLGEASSVVQSSATSATVKASMSDYHWCFQGEDKIYKLSFQGDNWTGPVTYNWIATPPERERGFYSVRDFGAKGDGTSDDTMAIKSAFAFIAFRNGGVLNFPEGDYLITSTVAVPSNVTIQGVSGAESNAPSGNYTLRNASRIKLRGKNLAMFRIGECTEKIVIKDIELFAEGNENTYGVEGVGAYNSSQDFYFQRVTFHNFFRGIYAHGLESTDLGWQFDYVRIDHCRFVYNRDAGIYVNSRNSDWTINDSLFQNPKKQPGWLSEGIHLERVMLVLIQNSFGGGVGGNRGGTFISILDSQHTTIMNSQAENVEYSLRYNAIDHPGAGDFSSPIAMINNMFGEAIEFKARRTLVSTGNYYGGNTFHADQWLRVYSTGDRFCFDGIIAGCRGTGENSFDKATVIFRTGQPAEGNVRGFPTFFGTDVQFGVPPQMPKITQSALPANSANGSFLYCPDCRRSTTPCQAGGSGAPAMVVNNQWSCL
jgi:Pectate lyase superfamily protein